MKFGLKLSAIFLVSACALSTQAHAQTSGLEQLVTSYVKSAVETTKQELNTQVQHSITSATHFLSVGENEENTPVTKVTITDINNENEMTDVVTETEAEN